MISNFPVKKIARKMPLKILGFYPKKQICRSIVGALYFWANPRVKIPAYCGG
jgi:hypothetical protein